MSRVPRLLVLLALGSGATPACARVSSLRAGASAVSADGEIAAVRAKADEAKQAGLYADAWNLEAAAGRDRPRLEAIALAALAANEGPFERMLEELSGAFGGLSPAARAEVGGASKRAADAGEWVRAVELELAAADDAPTYAAAFELYRRTPPGDALDVLRAIERARANRAARTGAR